MGVGFSVDSSSVKASPVAGQLVFPDLHQLRFSPASKSLHYGASSPSVLELCAGAGGQAVGFEAAGFFHAGLVEIDKHACATLRLNRPAWNVIEADLRDVDGTSFNGVDLIAGGLPCPPFSVAGKQLGIRDERNLFPELIRLAGEIKPKAIMVENVRGLLEARFDEYRAFISAELIELGFVTEWRLLTATNFGVPQSRQRAVMVGLRPELMGAFDWPEPRGESAPHVGELLFDLMNENGWEAADDWRKNAASPAPTIVGGSHKHGGPDLGPTRARAAWAQLGVDGLGIANQAPCRDFVGLPRLTLRMVARIQGFPDDWQFAGGKTAAYRQIGNAMPPPMALAVALRIKTALAEPFRISSTPAIDAELSVR